MVIFSAKQRIKDKASKRERRARVEVCFSVEEKKKEGNFSDEKNLSVSALSFDSDRFLECSLIDSIGFDSIFFFFLISIPSIFFSFGFN